MGDATEARELIAVLRTSVEKLSSLVDGLEAGALGTQSYDTEWTIAQVLSHLGSGAEIFSMIFSAAAAGEEPPGRETFATVWQAWDARSEEQKAADSLATSEALLLQFASVDDQTLGSMSIEIFGAERDANALLRMRLFEQVLHSWDIAVMFDNAAELLAEAVPHLVDHLGPVVARVGKPAAGAARVRVRTTDPASEVLLVIGESVELSAGAAEDGTATLDLPSAALVRLVYGRLDADHTPEGVTAEGVDLDDLRAVFPGF
jgi:uncharacterized protein (TIGR03083 family)